MADNDLKDLKLYSLKEIEAIVGVTRRTLFNYIKDGRLKASMIGGAWRVTGDNLRLFLYGKEEV